ncbi:MAG TPA: SurA N-terminal domain-containing protein [Afifellaceae bacterium]|nr:SurA N-terminal domain-containing protein [Afifellaceae bacterium]
MTAQKKLTGIVRIAGMAAVALWLGLAPVGPAAAQSAIKVLVNDHPITTYDVSNRARFLQLTSSGRAGEKQAMEELIDERLKIEEAQRLNIRVSDADVDSALAEIARRAQLAPAELDQALRREGVNPDTLKNRIRAELAWAEVVRARFRATVKVTDQDIAEAMAGREGVQEAPALQQYDVQPIIFVVPERASDAYRAQRRREADAFRSRFVGCEGALEQAKGLKDVVVRPTVRREESQIDRATAETLAGTEVGGTTPVQQVDEGYQLLGLCAKRALEGQTKASEELRMELLNERGQLMARRYIRDLRSDAIIEYR